MSEPRLSTRLAFALLAATCLTPVTPARSAPGDPIGPVFQVHTTTAYGQTQPAVAMDADGDFVVVWRGWNPANENVALFGQRFDPAGVAQGVEFQVSPFTTHSQHEAAIAMAADGDFVVVWEASDGPTRAVFARRFDAAGSAQGPEFQVNTFANGYQGAPDIAMDTDGDFVVVWQSRYQDSPAGFDEGVYAQRYSAAGLPQGPEFRVSTYTTGQQEEPAVAMDDDGNFVVAWDGTGNSGGGVYAQRFDAAGVAQGTEFLVDSPGFSPAVAMDADGDFVVAWYDSTGIHAQRYDAAGLAQGPEFLVDSSVWNPTLAMDADGGFIVAWEGCVNDSICANCDLLAQRYRATGEPKGGDILIDNSSADLPTNNALHHGAVAMDADGDFVAAWQSQGQDGDGWGIFAQRFQGAERVAGDFDGDGNADLLWRNTVTGNTVVWLMDGESRLDEDSIGAPSTTWEIAGTGDFNGDGKADILWRNTATGAAVVWQMNGLEKAASRSIGKPPLVWAIEQIRDTDGDGLSDIVWRHAGTGSTLVWRMSGFTKVSAAPLGAVNADWQLR